MPCLIKPRITITRQLVLINHFHQILNILTGSYHQQHPVIRKTGCSCFCIISYHLYRYNAIFIEIFLTSRTTKIFPNDLIESLDPYLAPFYSNANNETTTLQSLDDHILLVVDQPFIDIHQH